MNVNWHKNSLNNFICHLSWFEKLSPTHTHPLKTICEFSKPYELLFFELESLIKCWMWIGKNSLNNFICHLSWFKKLSPTHTHPLKTICEFSELETHKMLNVLDKSSLIFWVIELPLLILHPLKIKWVIIFWVRVTCKMLNVTCIKIHSIILSFTCHGLRNFPLLIHIHSKPFVNFQNPMSYYFLS